jgi:acetyltransferase-like isoleucine patch superfamily enzyme
MIPKIGKLLSRIRKYRYYLSKGITFSGRCHIEQGCIFKTVGSGSIQVGTGVYFEERVLVQSAGRLVIGNDVYFNRDTVVVALGDIEIGDYSRTGERVSIRDHDHRFDRGDLLIRDQGYNVSPIKIGKDCWIGCNSVILKGVSIGDQAVVGAASVVTKDVPAGSLALGVPARVVRSRDATMPRNP